MPDYLSDTDHPISLLGFGTTGIVLLAAVLLLWFFLRSNGHRHPMAGQHDRTIREMRAEGGAGDGPPR